MVGCALCLGRQVLRDVWMFGLLQAASLSTELSLLLLEMPIASVREQEAPPW